jgi:ketosteroid isomerase-like protein
MNRFRLVAITICLLFSAQNLLTQAQSQDDEASKAIIAVLNAQRDAWNRRDVEGYMAGYDNSDSILFLSGDSVSRGWQTVHDRYAKNYNTREKMGTLTFSETEIRLIDKHNAVMIGRWHLKRANDEPHGRFTLIFKRTAAGWRIVHDHTSSA